VASVSFCHAYANAPNTPARQHGRCAHRSDRRLSLYFFLFNNYQHERPVDAHGQVERLTLPKLARSCQSPSVSHSVAAAVAPDSPFCCSSSRQSTIGLPLQRSSRAPLLLLLHQAPPPVLVLWLDLIRRPIILRSTFASLFTRPMRRPICVDTLIEL
jgi:hypothetical protein